MKFSLIGINMEKKKRDDAVNDDDDDVGGDEDDGDDDTCNKIFKVLSARMSVVSMHTGADTQVYSMHYTYIFISRSKKGRTLHSL